MGTRGSITVKGKTHYIHMDAYPEFAMPILKKAAKSKNPIATANRLAKAQGYSTSWVDSKPMSRHESTNWIGDTLFNEHQYRIEGKRALHAKTMWRGDKDTPKEFAQGWKADPMGRFSRRR